MPLTPTSLALDWVMTHMPTTASQALSRFTELNPHWRGAHWDDCLDRLIDADAHLDITEPLSVATYEGLSDQFILDGYDIHLVDAVAITILYADRNFALHYSDAMRAVAVKATIDSAS